MTAPQFEWPAVDPHGQSTDSLVRLLNTRLSKLARAVAGKQGVLGWINVREFGASGDGLHDDTEPLQQSLTQAIAKGYGLWVPPGDYRVTAALAITATVTICGIGRPSRFRKAHTGDVFTVSAGRGVTLMDLSIYGDVAANPAYGTTGRGIYFSASGTDDPVLTDLWIDDIDMPVEFAGNAGAFANCSNLHLDPYTTTAGAEGHVLKLASGDTGATQRQFVNVYGNGVIETDGTQDAQFTNCTIRRPVTSATDFNVHWSHCTFGALNQPMTMKGTTAFISECRFAGAITLDSSLTGAFVNNAQTFGTFTDNTVATSIVVIHRLGGDNYVRIGRHKLNLGATGGVIQTSRCIAPGDADVTYSVPSSGNCIVYNVALTTTRTVTLDTTNPQDGDRVQVVRTSTASGANLLSVGGLVNLTPGTYAWAEFNGSAWVITEYGRLAVSYPLSVGGDPLPNAALYLTAGYSTTGATSGYGAYVDTTHGSAITGQGTGLFVNCRSAAAAFVMAVAIGMQIGDAVKGAGSTIITQYGLKIEDQTQGGMNYALHTGAGLVRFGDDVDLASGKVLKVNGTQVVGSRDTGWTAMTGTPDEGTTYDTGSVTLPQLAGRVMALQAALTAHGLIGA